MRLITISREFCSGGRELGKRPAGMLDRRKECGRAVGSVYRCKEEKVSLLK